MDIDSIVRRGIASRLFRIEFVDKKIRVYKKEGNVVSHSEQMHFFERVFEAFPEYFSQKVLDVGSLDINGGPHRILEAEEYVGVDIAPGPNVTLVSRGEDLSLPSNYFNASISSECFEHNPSWRSTLYNMVRMTAPGGLVVFSCATTGRREHGTTRSDGGFSAPLVVQLGVEYYRNVSEKELMECIDKNLFSFLKVFRNHVTQDLYFFGIKIGSTSTTLERAESFVNLYSEHLEVSGSRLRRFEMRANDIIFKVIRMTIPPRIRSQIRLWVSDLRKS